MEKPFTVEVTRPVQCYSNVAALQQVMRAVEDRLPDILVELTPLQRPLLPNALLNLSVNSILSEEGGAATAAILQRLAALILAGDRPDGGDGFRLNGRNA
jgi:hypothetical protein